MSPISGSHKAENVGVVIVEDEDLFRDLLRIVLLQQEGIEVLGSFAEAESALAAIPDLRPQVAILDIQLGPGLNGIQLGLRLRRRLPGLGIVLLSNLDDPVFLSSLREEEIAGWSYLLKRSVRDAGALVRAIRGAAEGRMVLDEAVVRGRQPRTDGVLSGLTPRQMKILSLMAQGLGNAAIAERLVLSEKTVENHINGLYQQLDLQGEGSSTHTRVKAVVLYLLESRRGRR
ncbi:MAG: response regulator transcription factor [Chloroflexi bacterium]|nr:response regulator transcription factor [Chloroflexota bacterium]